MDRFFNDTKYAISWGILGLLVVSVLASVFLLTKVFSEVGRIDNPQGYQNTITVTGKGEVVAIPDIASLSFSVVEASENVSTAQKLATEKFNKIFTYIKDSGIEEKDIKTTSYNVYPKYEWIQPFCISEINCPRGKNELVGYEVSQTVKIKVRDTQKAGDLLSGIGGYEVSNISQLSFEVDDEETLNDQAREIAINDAKDKAKSLAKDLGVSLGDVVNFSEASTQQEQRMYSEAQTYGLGGNDSVMMAPSIPTGENSFVKQVYITYKIK